MITGAVNLVLWGALSMAAWVAGLFFLRFWRLSRDRLFAFFAIAFWLLGLNWLALALVNPGRESQHELYVVRLIAFVLIIIGIVDKNRRSRLPQPTPTQTH
jgi:hypothetical protein